MHRSQNPTVRNPGRFANYSDLPFAFDRAQLVNRRIEVDGIPLPRAICDYLAGMTDRYAQDEHLRLFQPNTLV